MKNNTIVSLADSNYFDLLNELVDSILKFPEGKEVDICILDAGLSDEQKKILSNKVKEIKKAEWDIEVPGYKVGQKEWLKSQVSRAFLPKYFPGYKKYLWIDCDAWVQDWSSVELYFKACESGKLGITQTMGPGYRIMSKVKWLFGKVAVIKSQNFKHAISSKIGTENARKLAFAPHINIGVFSLEEKSPCWSSWQKNLNKTLNNLGDVSNNLSQLTDSLNQMPLSSTVKNFELTSIRLKSVISRLDSGEGSAGMILNDKKLYDNLVNSSRNLAPSVEPFV